MMECVTDEDLFSSDVALPNKVIKNKIFHHLRLEKSNEVEPVTMVAATDFDCHDLPQNLLRPCKDLHENRCKQKNAVKECRNNKVWDTLTFTTGSTVCNLEEFEAVDFTDVAKCGRTILVGSTAIGTNIQILNSQIDHKRSWMMKDSHYVSTATCMSKVKSSVALTTCKQRNQIQLDGDYARLAKILLENQCSASIGFVGKDTRFSMVFFNNIRTNAYRCQTFDLKPAAVDCCYDGTTEEITNAKLVQDHAGTSHTNLAQYLEGLIDVKAAQALRRMASFHLRWDFLWATNAYLAQYPGGITKMLLAEVSRLKLVRDLGETTNDMVALGPEMARIINGNLAKNSEGRTYIRLAQIPGRTTKNNPDPAGTTTANLAPNPPGTTTAHLTPDPPGTTIANLAADLPGTTNFNLSPDDAETTKTNLAQEPAGTTTANLAPDPPGKSTANLAPDHAETTKTILAPDPEGTTTANLVPDPPGTTSANIAPDPLGTTTANLAPDLTDATTTNLAPDPPRTTSFNLTSDQAETAKTNIAPDPPGTSTANLAPDHAETTKTNLAPGVPGTNNANLVLDPPGTTNANLTQNLAATASSGLGYDNEGTYSSNLVTSFRGISNFRGIPLPVWTFQSIAKWIAGFVSILYFLCIAGVGSIGTVTGNCAVSVMITEELRVLSLEGRFKNCGKGTERWDKGLNHLFVGGVRGPNTGPEYELVEKKGSSTLKINLTDMPATIFQSQFKFSKGLTDVHIKPSDWNVHVLSNDVWNSMCKGDQSVLEYNTTLKHPKNTTLIKAVLRDGNLTQYVDASISNTECNGIMFESQVTLTANCSNKEMGWVLEVDVDNKPAFTVPVKKNITQCRASISPNIGLTVGIVLGVIGLGIVILLVKCRDKIPCFNGRKTKSFCESTQKEDKNGSSEESVALKKIPENV